MVLIPPPPPQKKTHTYTAVSTSNFRDVELHVANSISGVILSILSMSCLVILASPVHLDSVIDDKRKFEQTERWTKGLEGGGGGGGGATCGGFRLSIPLAQTLTESARRPIHPFIYSPFISAGTIENGVGGESGERWGDRE